MRIAIHDAEQDHMPNKTFPNYALMKISAWHKAQGDTVEWFNAFDAGKYDKVYSSKVFNFTPENEYLPINTHKGGSGYLCWHKRLKKWYCKHRPLKPEIDAMFPDYSIYPSCDHAIGFLTRGCNNKCPWCGVPRKEGKIKPYRTVAEIVHPDSNKIVFMDNNILQCAYGIEQLKVLATTEYTIDFNQGMDIRLITEEIIDILKNIRWIRHIRFSCDSESQIKYFEKWMPIFKRLKMASKLFVYLIVTNDVANAERRVRALHAMNRSFTVYAQSERNIGKVITAEQNEFTERYMHGNSYKKETWHDYCEKRGFKYV